MWFARYTPAIFSSPEQKADFNQIWYEASLGNGGFNFAQIKWLAPFGTQ